MIISVAYDEGQIGEHFGHAKMFAFYEFDEAGEQDVTKKLVDCSDRHGHNDMAQLMNENHEDAVIVGNMGDEAKAALLSMGIIPVIGYCGPADMAAEMLAYGQLPINPYEGGGCGGGCGGCSGGCGGGCGGDEEGGCGCGCGH